MLTNINWTSAYVVPCPQHGVPPCCSAAHSMSSFFVYAAAGQTTGTLQELAHVPLL